MTLVVVVEVATVETDLQSTDGLTTLHRRRLVHLLTMNPILSPTSPFPLPATGSGRHTKVHAAYSRKRRAKSKSSTSRLGASGGHGVRTCFTP